MPVFVIILTCFALSGKASNILSNPGFETGTFSGWTMHTTESWSMGPNATVARSGTYGLWMQGLYLNGGAPSPYTSYAYQTFACAPGSTFTADAWFSQFVLRVPSEGGSSGGSGLFGANSTGPLPGGNGYYEDGWVEVAFLDSASNILSDYKSFILNPAYVAGLAASGATVTNITATYTNIYLAWIDCPVTNQYDPTALKLNADPDPNGYSNTNGAPWTIITNTLGSGQYMVAPPGTKYVQFRLSLNQTVFCSGAPHWDDCVLDQVGGPSPSVIGSISPDGTQFFNIASTNFTFNVASASTGGAPLPTNPTNGIQVVVNGVNQSGSLQFSGTLSNWNVSLPNFLASNTLYNISISVSNSAGLISTASLGFDTFDGSDFIVESECYDSTNGLYFENPIPTAVPTNNSYTGLGAVWGVDMNTYGAPGALPLGAVQLVRADGRVAFQRTTDLQLPLYLAQSNPAVYNVAIAYNNGGNWMNYTRIYPTNGPYKVYARMSGGAGLGEEFLNLLTSGYGTTNQTTNNIGEFYIPNGTDWNHYMWVPLTYGRTANLVAVTLPASRHCNCSAAAATTWLFSYSFHCLAPWEYLRLLAT